MTLSPILALGFGWEAFLPVALSSVVGGAICLLGKDLSTRMEVGQLTAELLQDLASADKDRRELVLAELNKAEANWLLAELPRAQAELRRRPGQPPRRLVHERPLGLAAQVILQRPIDTDPIDATMAGRRLGFLRFLLFRSCAQYQILSSPGRGGTSRTLAITRSNFSQFPRLARTATVSRVRQAET